MIGATSAVSLPAALVATPELFASVVGLVAVVIVLILLNPSEKHEEGQAGGGPSPDRIAGAVAVGLIAAVIIVIILFTEVVRIIVATATSVTALFLTLALWRIPRSRPWGGWLVATIATAIAYLLLALPFWWPLSLTQWLLVLLPYVAAAAIGSLVGAIVSILRRRSGAREAALRQALLSELEVLFRAKLRNDSAAVLERSLIRAESEAELVRRETIRKRNAAHEVRALEIASEQGDANGPRHIKKEVALQNRVLNRLYLAVERSVRQPVLLEPLARLTRLPVEMTYSLVSTLEDRQEVITTRNQERDQWTEIWVYLGHAGAKRVEGRRAVSKKKITKVGKGAAYVERTKGSVALSVVGRDMTGQVHIGVSALDESIDAVVQAARALRAELSEQHQIDALDSEIQEIEQAKDEPAKKSALERLRGIAAILGPIAKPLLDLVNGVIDLMSPTK